MSHLTAVADRPHDIEAASASLADQDRREAFGALTAVELTPAYNLADRILNDRGEAEDAVHEAVLRAWNAFDKLKDQTLFRAWFTRIVVNICRDKLRRRKIVRFEPLGDIDPPARDPYEHGIARDAIRQALETLSPEQRIVVVLRFFNDLQVNDIARIVGIPAGTVKWRLHAACKNLRVALGDAGWEDDQ
jgi:RNA polymerase sigma-70 factor (ECF subfamily)